jgi:hypothetical protein
MSNDDILPTLLIVLIFLLLGFIMGANWVQDREETIWQEASALTECARFHPDTGEFEWN